MGVSGVPGAKMCLVNAQETGLDSQGEAGLK